MPKSQPGEILSHEVNTNSEACLACSADARIRYRLPHIWHEPADSRPYDIRWCGACDFGFLDPRPPLQDQERFHAEGEVLVAPAGPALTILERARLHLAWRAGSSRAREIDARLIQSVITAPNASICVFGYDRPELWVELAKRGIRVVGVELNDRASSRDQSPGIEILTGSVEAPPKAIAESSFDVVVLNHVLQACREPKQALRNAHRFLMPGGTLIAEVPNNGAYSARRFGAAWLLCDAGRQLNFFTETSLSKFFRDAEFSVKDTFYRQYLPQFTSSRLLIEQETWDRLYTNASAAVAPCPPRKSAIDLWTGLARTIFLGPSGKFEIIGMVATKRPE